MTAAPKLTEADWQAIEREYCERRLSNFIRSAWPVLEPSDPYVHGWHIDAICEHLEAVSHGEIKRLLINVPYGTMKSLATGVFWPAWEWTRWPSTRYVAASHEQGLAVRDNLRMRRIVGSEWYQSLWPTPLTRDQNAKIKFENDSTGFRQACSVSSMTGNRGHRVIWDDPISAEQAASQSHRETAIRELQETVPTRLVNPKTSAIVIVMQRLHERDPSGVVLEGDHGFEHLCLPMEYEPERKCVTGIGFEDPRTEEGELLFPERFPREVVEADKKIMGAYAVAGQLQQRPAPRGGGMFPVDRFQITPHKPAPDQIKASVRYWDKAGTAGGGAYTAGVLMHLLKDGSYAVSDVVRGQWSALERERRIKQTAQMDGAGVDIWVEQEPGSGGKESAESTIRSLAGYRVRAERVTGDKESRAEPYAAQVEGGNVWLVQGDWNRAFVQEHEVFPAGQYKDQVDAAAGAFAKLAKPPQQTDLGMPVQVR